MRTPSNDAGDGEILSAAWVAPVSGGILREGAVVMREGRIAAVGPADSVRSQYPGAMETELGEAVLLPGLVNAHAHLELSSVERPSRPGSFVEWLGATMSQTLAKARDASYFVEAAQAGVKQSLNGGGTSVGDVSGSPFVREIRAALAGGHCRVTSYGEVTAMAQRRRRLEDRIAVATDASAIAPPVRMAISPHAPYSIEGAGYRRCLEVARSLHLPIMTHLAETPYEGEFLASHSGPFRRLWDAMKAWDDEVPTFRGGPIRYADTLGLLDYSRTLLAHVNYCDDAELGILAGGKASVAYCPRTHEYFGHPPHRFREMLGAGINVALGTDSCASSPDLNFVEELRLVHRIAPELPVETIWEMGTIRGAKAIGADDVGSLAVGKRADVVAFAVRTKEPLREILDSGVVPSGVWVGGRRVEPGV